MIERCWRCDELYVASSGVRVCPKAREVQGTEAYCQSHWEPVSDRQLMDAIYAKICTMPDLAELQSVVLGMASALSDFQPVVQANVDLSIQVIAKLDELSARIAALEPTQQAIDELAAVASAALDTIHMDKAAVVAVNQAYNAELAKIAPPEPAGTPDSSASEPAE